MDLLPFTSLSSFLKLWIDFILVLSPNFSEDVSVLVHLQVFLLLVLSAPNAAVLLSADHRYGGQL